jgi:3'(2'), 5'-bisphosphate nucleotidase
MNTDFSGADLRRIIGIGLRASLFAGDAVMQIYDSDFEVHLKSDQSPITEADRQSHKILTTRLDREIPILSEEGSTIAYEERKYWNLFWLTDPLDGTKEFIKRNGEFTVNVALIERHYPIAGIVYLPAKEILYFGGRGFGSYRISGDVLHKIKESDWSDALKLALACAVSLPDLHNPKSPQKIKITQSISHVTEEEADFALRLKAKFEDLETTSAGSSLKFCFVAEGRADLYPRFGPTMEWDTAAGQCIAESCGCEVLDLSDISPLRYNKPVLRNSAFMVIGTRFRFDASWRKSILELAQASRNAPVQHP